MTTGHVATGLAVINLWMLGALLLQNQGIWARFYTSPDLAALTLLPVTQENIFRWQLQKVFRFSLVTLFNLCVGFGVLVCCFNLSPWKWVASFLVAILSWVALFAMQAFSAARLPKKPFQIIAAGLIFTGMALFFGRKIIGNLVIKTLDQYAPELNLLLPTGWPVSLFQTFASENQWWPLFLLFPITLIVWTTKDSLQRLLKGFEFREHILAQPSDLVPGEYPAKKSSPDKPLQLGLTAIEEIIQSRKFLGPPLWPQRGWFEQRLWRWFEQREKALAEFVFPNGFSILAPWIKTFRNLLIAAVIGYAAGLVNPTWKFCILGLGLFITVCQTLGQILNQGRAFQPWWCSGVNIPMYSVYGIGYRELSRVLFKCSIIQIPLLLAFALAAGLATAFLADYPLIAGMMIGLKLGCLLFASRFIFVTLAFSSGTNDSSKFRLRTVLLIFIIVLSGLMFIGLAWNRFVCTQPTNFLDALRVGHARRLHLFLDL